MEKCIFCLGKDGPFRRQEHPIPESLGNDDLVLPPGHVCDHCNQYFGSKVEQRVLGAAPFGVARVTQAVKNKSGKHPRIIAPGLSLQSTGYWDQFVVRSDPPHRHLLELGNGRVCLNPPWASPELIVRFLIKMGLELLVFGDGLSPLADQFDDARRCARYGRNASTWDFGMGFNPLRDSVVRSSRVDEDGPLETRDLYEYGIGVMHSGDVVFCFVYETMVFAVNLSRTHNLEYILGFNDANSFHINSRWNLFRQSIRVTA